MMTKSTVFFWLLVSFIAGVGAVSYLPLGLAAAGAVFGLGGALLAFGIMADRTRLAVAGACAIALAGGMIRFMGAGRPPPASLVLLAGERASITGVVDDNPVRRAQTQQLVVRRDPGGERTLLIHRPFPAYAYGDRIRAEGRIERPENFSPDFDYAAYLAKDDIFSLMRFPEIELLGRGTGLPLYHFLFRLKERFSGNLASALPEPHSAFLAGLIVGERQSFPPSLTEALRASGTSHLVALSGYNITIVADALLKALAMAFVPFRLAFWLALTGIAGFVMLTGAQASVVRAAVMGALVLVARRSGRLYRMRNALALAAVAMLVVNPRVLRFDLGFQLSFLATLGLVYGAPVVEEWYGRVKNRIALFLRDAGLIRPSYDVGRAAKVRRHLGTLLRETLIATLAAQLAVIPLLVYHFGTLSLVSPLANLAIIPVIPATMFFGFITGAAGFLADAAARIVAAPAIALLGYELGAIAFFSRLPFAAVALTGFGSSVLIIGYLGFGLLLWRRRRSGRAALRRSGDAVCDPAGAPPEVMR